MKCVINLVLPIILCGFFGCCSMDEMDFRDVEYKPADLGNYDEGLLVYDAGFYKSEPEYVHPSLCGVAVLYPNLVALRINSEDEKEREIDFSWLRHIRKLSHVDVSGRWSIRGFEEFGKNRAKENITVRLSYGDWYSLEGEICQMPRVEVSGEKELLEGGEDDVSNTKIRDYIVGDCEKCRLSFHEFHDLYKQGDSLRSADFGNDGDGVVTIRNFPGSCNALGLFGDFELLESCKGELVESIVVEGNGERVRDLLKAITPSRFPRLRYLKVHADSDDEIEVDMTGLLHFPGMKMLTFKSKNVIPNGLTKLHCLGERSFLEFKVAIRRNR